MFTKNSFQIMQFILKSMNQKVVYLFYFYFLPINEEVMRQYLLLILIIFSFQPKVDASSSLAGQGKFCPAPPDTIVYNPAYDAALAEMSGADDYGTPWEN